MKFLYIIFSIINLVQVLPAYCQGVDPDNKYREEKKIADSLYKQVIQNRDSINLKTNARKATLIFIDLAKKYRLLTTDMVSFFNISSKAENSEGFYSATKLLIMNSGLPLSNALHEYYGENTDFLYTHEPYAAVLKKIKKEESKLLEHAHLHLDWMWNIELSALYSSDQSFRSLPTELFKDQESRIAGMVIIDSTNIVKFCKNIIEYGFPNMSKVGLNAAESQVLLRHFTGLIFPGIRENFYIEKWQFLMPYLHTAVINGEIEYNFYNHILDWVTTEIKETNRTEELYFFDKYKLNN